MRVTDPSGKLIATLNLPTVQSTGKIQPLATKARPCLPEGTKVVLEQMYEGRISNDELAFSGAVIALIAAGGAALVVDIETVGLALPLNEVALAGVYVTAVGAYRNMESDINFEDNLEATPFC